MRSIIVFCAMVGLVSSWTFPCQADVVTLDNGDRISGKVLSATETVIVVETPYAGKVEIKREAVVGVTTEDERLMRFKDGAVAGGILQYGETQMLVDGEETAPLDLTTVDLLVADQAALDAAVKKESRIWSGSVASGVTFRRGTTDTFDTTLDVTAVRKKPRHALTLNLRGAYGEVEDTLNTQRVFGETKLQVYPGTGRLYVFSLASGEHDKPRKLHLRTTIAGGLGYDFIQQPRRSLSGDVGVDYARERWRAYGPGQYRAARDAAWDASVRDFRALLARPPSPATLIDAPGAIYRLFVLDVDDRIRREDVWSARLSLQFSQRLFENAQITDSLKILPAIDDFGEFRLVNSLAFTTPVTESLDLRLNLQTEYDSNPGVAGVTKFDNILTAGLRYAF